MRVVVTTESRFDRTPDGACWVAGWASYDFWTRYLDVFDRVEVLARVRDVPRHAENAVRADGAGVSITALAFYEGPWAYLRNYRALRDAARRTIASNDAVIVRAPGATTSLAIAAAGGHRRPFGVEVVGDPQQTFATGGVRTVLRPVLRHSMTHELRVQCARACAVAYVTAGSLQRLYPPRAASFVTSYSSIVLPPAAFVPEPRAARAASGRLVFVGSLEQFYKGPDVLIDAVAIAARNGRRLAVTLVGDGRHRPELELRASAARVADRVRFVGQVPPGARIREEIDRADVFVLPSRTEGLPRALIEAMARGLPCVGSDVGGIPELLGPAERVPPGDPAALASALSALLDDPERLARLSRENLQKAREYDQEALRPRRQAFYAAVRDATARSASRHAR